MKKYLFFLSIFILTMHVGHSQTNVSGGIYSNTTWTLANSPYIVVDTVVVFPNITLTIQPGVVVKFANNKRLEIRQAKLIANGSITDSITFTSNSISPSIGIWSSIYITGGSVPLKSEFSYCNFRYANNAINPYNDTILIKNSSFNFNNIGIGWVYFTNIYIDSCNFRNNINGIKWATGRIIMRNSVVTNNQNGIISPERSTYYRCRIDSNSVIGITTQQSDSIIECEIKYNGIGLDDGTSGGSSPNFITKNIIENNDVGIQLRYWNNHIFCNRICNNTTYALKSTFSMNTNCVVNNYWCTVDSASTSAVIYDGYDNINLGLISFMPIDTFQCYLTTEIKNPVVSYYNSFKIYPNPFNLYAILEFENPNMQNYTLTIYDSQGILVRRTTNIKTNRLKIEKQDLVNGLFFFQLQTDKQIIATGKFIIE